jgi:hypothetical protein
LAWFFTEQPRVADSRCLLTEAPDYKFSTEKDLVSFYTFGIRATKNWDLLLR